MSDQGWRRFGGHAGSFFRFTEEGDELVGVWLGSKPGRYESRVGVVRSEDGEEVAFSLSRALEDLDLLPKGTRVKIVFRGWETSKAGTRFKVFNAFTMGDVQPLPAKARPSTTADLDSEAEDVEPDDDEEDPVPF